MSNNTETTPTPMIPAQWKRIYENPLSMTLGEFVMLMQLAKDRLITMGAKFDEQN